VIRVTYELHPPEAAETLALVESVGRADGPEHVRGRVVDLQGERATLEFPAATNDVALPARRGAVARRVPAGPGVRRAGGSARRRNRQAVARAVTLGGRGDRGAAQGGNDELLGNPEWCPLEERVRAAAGAGVNYAANVTGPVETLLERAARVVALGAGAVMINAFAQGIDALRALREAELGAPIFAHRVGAALWARQPAFGVAPAVVAEVTRLCGADYVQVGSFSGTVYDSADDVRAQISACHREIGSARRSVAVIGGGVGPGNAREQLDAAGTRDGVMVLFGSAAYDGARPKKELEMA
jgi:Ribulose bisphosphate carboxylase large chain, catalytic domain